jgi:hypothetical protein
VRLQFLSVYPSALKIRQNTKHLLVDADSGLIFFPAFPPLLMIFQHHTARLKPAEAVNRQ